VARAQQRTDAQTQKLYRIGFLFAGTSRCAHIRCCSTAALIGSPVGQLANGDR
jgi:hypothetical protein